MQYKECIEQMKRRVVEESMETCEGRAWLETSIDPYKNQNYRTTLLVLEASPSKGCVLINHSEKWVNAINPAGRLIGTAKWL